MKGKKKREKNAYRDNNISHPPQAKCHLFPQDGSVLSGGWALYTIPLASHAETDQGGHFETWVGKGVEGKAVSQEMQLHLSTRAAVPFPPLQTASEPRGQNNLEPASVLTRTHQILIMILSPPSSNAAEATRTPEGEPLGCSMQCDTQETREQGGEGVS